MMGGKRDGYLLGSIPFILLLGSWLATLAWQRSHTNILAPTWTQLAWVYGGAFLLFGIARKRQLGGWTAFFLAALYLFHIHISEEADCLWGFPFALPLWFGGVLCAEMGLWWAIVVHGLFLGWMGMASGASLVAFGLLVPLLHRKNGRAALLLVVGGAAMTFYSIGPALHWQELREAVAAQATQSTSLPTWLIHYDHRGLLLRVFGPWLFLPLFAPHLLLPILPAVASGWLLPLRETAGPLWMEVRGLGFLALIYGLSLQSRWLGAVTGLSHRKIAGWVAGLILALRLTGLITAVPVPSVDEWAAFLRTKSLAREAASVIPGGVPVSADSYFSQILAPTHPVMRRFPQLEPGWHYACAYIHPQLSNFERIGFLKFFQKGFLPITPNWGNRLLVLSDLNPPYGPGFLAFLERWTEQGFDFRQRHHTWWCDLIGGLSVPEEDGRWTDGREVTLPFYAGEPGGNWNARIKAQYFASYLPDLQLAFTVNGWPAGDLKPRQPSLVLVLPLPNSAIQKGVNLFSIRLSRTFSPLDLGMGKDRRRLGIKLSEVHFSNNPDINPGFSPALGSKTGSGRVCGVALEQTPAGYVQYDLAACPSSVLHPQASPTSCSPGWGEIRVKICFLAYKPSMC